MDVDRDNTAKGTDDSRVPAGVVCAQCRYELAGLDRAGLCPECGTPIRASFGGDLELYMKVEYLRGLAPAAQMVKRGVYLAMGVVVCWFVLRVLTGTAFGTTMLIQSLPTLVAAGGLLMALWFWGRGWQALAALSGPMPGVVEMQKAQQRLRVALLIQICAVAFALAIGIIEFIIQRAGGSGGVVPPAASNPRAWSAISDQVLRMPITLATGAAAVCGMQLVGRILSLFARTADAVAARRAGWAFAAALALFAIMGVLTQLGRGAIGPLVAGPFRSVFSAFSLITLLWLIAATTTLARCMGDLELVSRLALERANARNTSAAKVV